MAQLRPVPADATLGYVDDPEDPGGETNKGITMATFQDCAHELLGIEPRRRTSRP